MFPLGTYSAFELKFSMFLFVETTRHYDPRLRLLGIKALEHGVHGILQIIGPSHLAHEAILQMVLEAER